MKSSASPGVDLDEAFRLSWAQDGRTVIVDENTPERRYAALTVFGLDVTSGGGSLQAHSTIRLRQASDCSPCVRTALAGPDGSLTVLEAEPAGLRAHVSVVSLPPAGGPRTVGTMADAGQRRAGLAPLMRRDPYNACRAGETGSCLRAAGWYGGDKPGFSAGSLPGRQLLPDVDAVAVGVGEDEAAQPVVGVAQPLDDPHFV
jgi:hypothetical protein